jgi:hypothetical protein
VSGPSAAIQMFCAPSTFQSWCFQFSGPSPRPWSVVTRKVVFPRYSGMVCIVVQSSRMKSSTACALRSTRS